MSNSPSPERIRDILLAAVAVFHQAKDFGFTVGSVTNDAYAYEELDAVTALLKQGGLPTEADHVGFYKHFKGGSYLALGAFEAVGPIITGQKAVAYVNTTDHSKRWLREQTEFDSLVPPDSAAKVGVPLDANRFVYEGPLLDVGPLVDAYLESQNNALAKVKAELVKRIVDAFGKPESDILDDTVHDLASQPASDVNNGGLDSQVEYILKQLGIEEGRKTILELLPATE